MGSLSYQLLRRLLFRLESETAHNLASVSFEALATLCPPVLRRAGVKDQPVTFKGVEFPNRLGLAAGFDKAGRFLNGAQLLGFGFTEVGAVTPKPQPGHPKPRMWRYPAQRALRNRMGFNNPGTWALAKALTRRPAGLPVGVNLGKNAATALEEAADDYRASLESLYGLADFFVVNVSSPNTQGLRRLQESGLPELLGGLSKRCTELSERFELKRRPLLVKLSPDGPQESLAPLASAAVEAGVDGFIAANTTSRREGQYSEVPAEGGLSGPLLHQRAVEMISELRGVCGDEVLLVGCGGVHNRQTYQNFLQAGADLVQLYTGLVYEGPGLVRRVLKGE